MDASWLESSFSPALFSRYYSAIRADKQLPLNNDIPYAMDMIQIFQRHLDGKLLEFAWAYGIMEGLANNENEKIWIENFDQFKKQFPKSQLIGSLLPGIQRVQQYHQHVGQNTPGVQFLENGQSIKTLEALLERLKGQSIYMDLWATWCGPCKDELQHSIQLHDQIAAIGYLPVYLSMDKDNAEAK